MFKRIGGELVKRGVVIHQQTGNHQKIERIVERFYQSLGISGTSIPSVMFHPEQKTLTIETKSKAIASEVLFHITTLRSLLHQEGIVFQTITIH